MFFIESDENNISFVLCLLLASPHLSPASPILLYPVNRTFSITCSFLCEPAINPAKIIWLVDGEELNEDQHEFRREMLTMNAQRLTVFLNKKNQHFTSANYTCRYDDKETSVFVRRRTSNDLLSHYK